MNFATNPTKPGIADRDDQWFCAGHDQGVRSFSYGTAARTGGGGFTYTVVGAADSGNFDLTDRSVTVKGRCRETQRSPDARPDYEHTPIIGLRGATLVERYAQTVSIVTVAVGLSDSTRGGGTFTMKTCQ